MIDELVEDIKNHKTTAREQVEQALEKVNKYKNYNAILSLTDERALQRADKIDTLIADGKPAGKLAGVPFVVKDNFLAFGAPTTAASKILENFDSPYQATVVERLEAEGAICIGKSNLDAFAHGGSTENSAFGSTKNAIDDTRVAGGSSGGSAVVTALDIVPFALGSDTGGSIRQPASFNGVYGFKPSYGMTSRYGVVAMASSTDVMGCFTKNATDASLVMSVMAGPDINDQTTMTDGFKKLQREDISQLKIGIIGESLDESVDSDVQKVANEFKEKITKAGHQVETVSMPIIHHALAMYYIITSAEVSSNMARFDGVRYGKRSQAAKTIEDLYGLSRAEGLMAENKRRILIGSFVLSQGFFDAYYLQAQKARTLLINDFNKLFSKYDFLMMPTTAAPAFRLGENTSDPLKMYLTDIMTVPASLAGLPALSIPAGESSDDLPVGIQLIGPMKSDAKLLAAAEQLEGTAI